MGKQKRSENTYQKIDTIFKRDANNIIMPYNGLVSPELEWLRNCKFDCTEKIDGTNTRIEVTNHITYMDVQISNTETETDWNWPLYVEWSIEYKGKTDNAQVPKMLLDHLKSTYTEDNVLNALGLKKRMYLSDFTVDSHGIEHYEEFKAHQDAIDHKWVVLDGSGKPTDKIDTSKIPSKYTLYGEGYGAKIQSGGYYRKDNGFIGFDIKVDNEYLLRENMEEIFNKLECPIVPYIGSFTIDEAVEFVKKGFMSKIAQDEHLAEGLVCKSPIGLKNRRGERIVFKVKTCDWNKYYAKYNTYEKVEQPENKYY